MSHQGHMYRICTVLNWPFMSLVIYMYILTFAQYNMYQLIHIIVVKRYNKWPKFKWPYTLAYDGIKSKWGMLKKSTQLSFAKRS